jgi:four helix bundle protein
LIKIIGLKEKKVLRNYKDLLVWQKGYKLCLDIYKASKIFPKDEQYILVPQIRRAAVSIPSNTAEGYGRKSTKEYIQSLYIAYGSLCELETQILLANDLEYLDTDRFGAIQGAIEEVERMLKALIRSLEGKRLKS